MSARAVGLLALCLVAACGEDEPPAKQSPGTRSYTQEIPGTDVSFEMIWVPAGGFWIGKTEVTWNEYELYALTEETPEGVDAVSRPSRSYHPHDKGWGTDTRPACGMSRHAAERYCVWLSKKTGVTYRLPSGAEWQTAFDAGKPPEPRPLQKRAWFAANSEEKTQPVGTRAPNRLGIHDMLGNVMEYTTDTAPEDENGDRWPLLRGGSFADSAEKVNGRHKQPQLFVWNERDPQRPRSRWWLCDGPYVGFRVLRDGR